MPRRTKAKPKTPQEIQAEKLAARVRDFVAVNLPAGSAALATHNDVDANHAERDREDGARRVDAFMALRDGMKQGAYDAARRLEADIAKRFAETGQMGFMDRVDGSSRGGREDSMIEAGRTVDAVLARIGKRDAWLLCELIRPAVERSRKVLNKDGEQSQLSTAVEKGWRGVVSYITGEENPVAQGAAVRSACANLADAYETVDEIKKRLAA